MGRQATDVDAQIQLLKDRGLYIDDDEKAKEYLLDIGYYRLGFYWHYFEMDENHNLREGISLDDIIKLYYFDVDLRNLLGKYLYRIEVHFRTQVVYHVSNHYLQSPTWFNDPRVVHAPFIQKLPKIYTINLNLKMFLYEIIMLNILTISMHRPGKRWNFLHLVRYIPFLKI